MTVKINPNSAKNAAVIDALAALKRALENTATSSMGCSDPFSQTTKARPTTAAMAKPLKVLLDAHPTCGPSITV